MWPILGPVVLSMPISHMIFNLIIMPQWLVTDE